MTRRIFIPRDATARSLGADAVADLVTSEAARRGIAITVVRTGSRGAMWLEPLVEVEIEGQRHGFGPVTEADVAGLFEQDFLNLADHPLALGAMDALPWLARQTRVTFARCGVIDPLDLEAYKAHGGFAGLARALGLDSAAIISAVDEAGLRGRGGAGFPTGIKWRTVATTPADQKYIVCNADEGDSGTFSDRMLMEGDPFAVIEGMAIAGLAVGATRGFIYIRSEYPDAIATMTNALPLARAGGLLGPALLGSRATFDMEIRVGAGAYICGEETALLESLEGRRGEVRPKPPLPAVSGLFGKPTVINNLVTLATVPAILTGSGEAAYGALGTGRSRGTMPVQLGGNITRGGLVEVPFGTSLRTLIEDFGGGTASARPLKAVQLGGPLGAYLPPDALDVPLDYEGLSAIGAMLGHGGIVVFDDTADMGAQARFAMAFCALESCGKCTPCRIGSTRGVEVIDRIRAGENTEANLTLLEDLCATMTDGSLCALGGLTALPVTSALRHFPEDFRDTRGMP